MSELVNRLQTTVLMLAALATVALLGYTGKVGEQAVVAIVTAIVSFAAGTGSHALGVSQGSKASVSPPPEP